MFPGSAAANLFSASSRSSWPGCGQGRDAASRKERQSTNSPSRDNSRTTASSCGDVHEVVDQNRKQFEKNCLRFSPFPSECTQTSIRWIHRAAFLRDQTDRIEKDTFSGAALIQASGSASAPCVPCNMPVNTSWKLCAAITPLGAVSENCQHSDCMGMFASPPNACIAI